MPARGYICPMIGSGTKQDPYRSKAADMGFKTWHGFVPSNADGTPASPWSLTFIRSQDFSVIDADATCDDLFAGDLPLTIETAEDFKSWMRTRTIGDVPTARRNAIQAVLDKYAVPRTDFVLTTPLFKVWQRVWSTLFEKDFNTGAGFS